uniref:Uncharacterized protein n=1 Tax=Trypanosoma vivax (strain Y486) TaxID=1055687 RepID=G0TWY9_TRYVY|nr:conserved hypothetical protein [Trypanosoma vivax Y486]
MACIMDNLSTFLVVPLRRVLWQRTTRQFRPPVLPAVVRKVPGQMHHWCMFRMTQLSPGVAICGGKRVIAPTTMFGSKLCSLVPEAFLLLWSHNKCCLIYVLITLRRRRRRMSADLLRMDCIPLPSEVFVVQETGDSHFFCIRIAGAYRYYVRNSVRRAIVCLARRNWSTFIIIIYMHTVKVCEKVLGTVCACIRVCVKCEMHSKISYDLSVLRLFFMRNVKACSKIFGSPRLFRVSLPLRDQY